MIIRLGRVLVSGIAVIYVLNPHVKGIERITELFASRTSWRELIPSVVHGKIPVVLIGMVHLYEKQRVALLKVLMVEVLRKQVSKCSVADVIRDGVLRKKDVDMISVAD